MIELTIQIDVRNCAELGRKHGGIAASLLPEAALRALVEGKVREAVSRSLHTALTRELEERGVDAAIAVR